MDPATNNSQVPNQPQMVPMGDAWAPGVYAAPVASGPRRWRWAIAGAVVLCVVLVTAGAVYVLSGASGPKSLTASLAPKNTVAFMEIRTDLPGDQHAKLADFMSHFPGFKDRSQFDTALDEVLNRLTRTISPDLSYTSAFKPWMEGEVSIAVTNLGGSLEPTGGPVSTPVVSDVATPTNGMPIPMASFMNVGSGSVADVVAIVALKDHAAAQAWVTSELKSRNVTTTSASYAGTTVYSFGKGANSGSYAFTDQQLLMGTAGGVKAALDSKTNGSLADSANYKTAMDSLTGDSLARFYIDMKAIVAAELKSYNSTMSSLGGSSMVMPTMALSADSVPAWVVGAVRAEGTQMIVNVVMPRAAGAGTTAGDGNHVSRLAPSLPSSTVLVAEFHAIGKTATTALSAAEKQMPGDSSVKQVEDALGLIGGLDWIGDGSAVVTKQGSTYSGGLVIETTDATTASNKLSLLQTGLALGGSSMGLTSRSENHNGTSITIIHVASGVDSTVGGLDLAVAAKGNLIVAGIDSGFVKAVLDTTEPTSLGAQPDYKALIDAVGSSNSTSFYVNIPALEDQIGQAAMGVSSSRWTTDYKPYFDHLGGAGYAVMDGNTVILRFIVTAK
jgi:hypothetical protein